MNKGFYSFPKNRTAPDQTVPSASYAITASYVVTASYSVTASHALNGGSILTTGSTLYSISPLAGSNASAANSIFFGTSAGASAANAYESNFIGYLAGSSATNAYQSNFIGAGAGDLASNANNSNFFGYQTGYVANDSSYSNFIGYYAGMTATNAPYSNFLGHHAGTYALYASSSNFIGSYAGYTAAKASNSTLIGYKVGFNPDGVAYGIGSNNIIIGTNITLADGTKDSINLGAIIFATGSYSTITGTGQKSYSGSQYGIGRVGINIVSPKYTLDVSGSGNFSSGLTVTGSLNVSQNLTVLGTASFQYLTTIYETASVIYSSGSNQFGDAANDTQTLYGTVVMPTGNLKLTGSLLVTQSYISTVDYVDFLTGSNQTIIPGRIGWNDGDGTLNMGLKGGNLNLLIGETEVAYVYNAETSSLTPGTVVYITGSQGNRISVKRAFATSDATSAGTLGFVAETITAGSTGFIVVRGIINKLDTSAYSEGALLYLNGSAGQFSATKPVAPIHEVRLGYVQRSHASVGSIYVKVDNGYEIDELHDVLIVSASSGELLVRSGSLWTNSRSLTGSYSITGSLVISGSGATLEVYGNKIIAGAIGGDEGGEILLGKPYTNTTLTGSGITIDSYQNKIRFFEQGGTSRGAYIDITACAAGAGTNLLSGGGGTTFNGGTNVDNRIVTATGTNPELNGEANLTFNGSTLTVTGNITANSFTGSLQSLKAGSGSVASFGGSPYSSSIVFSSAFANNSYAVTVTGEDARTWTVESKSNTGFIINSNSSQALTGPVYWIATPFN